MTRPQRGGSGAATAAFQVLNPVLSGARHWSCYTTWPQEGRGGAAMAKLRREMLAVNSFRERLYDNPIGHIWMTTDGAHSVAPRVQDVFRLQSPENSAAAPAGELNK